MSYAHTPIRKIMLGLALLIFSIAPCNQAVAMLQEESPATQSPAKQSPAMQSPATPGELVELIQSDATGPILEIEAEGSVEIPPPAALVTDQVDPGAADLESAELSDSDSVGDSIGKVKDGSAEVLQDASVDAAEITSRKKTAGDAGDLSKPSEDEEAAVVFATTDDPSGTTPFLTPEHVGWLWKFIFVTMFIGFLLWLLSLMTAKSRNKNEPSSLGSGDSKSDALSADASGAATGDTKNINKSDIGKVYARRPEVVDDLTKIGGVDAAAEKRLNEAGIWQYDQLRSMNAQQRANLQRKLNLPRIRWYSLSGLSGATSTANADSTATATSAATATSTANAGASDSVGANRLRVDSGNPATANLSETNVQGTAVPPPKFRDDLTRLPGIDANLAAKLNQEGIHNVKQLQSFSPAQKLAFEKQHGVSFDKLNVEQFAAGSTVGVGQGGSDSSSSSSSPVVVGGFGALGVGAAAAGVAGLASSVHSNGSVGSTGHGNAGNNGNEADVNPQGHADDAMGFVYKTKPSDANDLTKLDGIDAAAAKRLNDAGIYKFEQLDQLDDHQKAAVIDRCQLSGFDITKCYPKIGRSDASLGFVYTEAPHDADDLTKLDGIDAAAAKRLNDAGIYKFEQLENLSDQQTDELVKQFDLSGANTADWDRCFYAWGRGIDTSAEVDRVLENGFLNGVELPQVADAVFDGEKLTGYDEQVIFKGSNPEGWGTGNQEIDGVETSIGCDTIRSDINFLRIRRSDTQESVVVPMTKGMIFSNGDPAISGWNGASEVFFGGRHVGAFAQHLPQEVETKFSQGGWGFGHRYDHNDRQEWGWAGRVIQPTTMEVSVGCIGKTPGTTVFRSSDPTIWNTETNEGESRFATPLDSVPHPVNFVRIMRQITGEAVIVRVDGGHLLDEGFDPRLGWNGSGSEFSGGRHLGVYHTDLPQDFETRFEFGGWGFGHPYNDNDRQAWGWAGRQLPETIFEISLLESVPDHMQHEVIA